VFSILIFAVAGAIAQFVDGTLGMAFGITSSTLLIALGATPVAASAAVHFAEIGTTLASGTSHWREGNVDKRILIRLAIPGGIGAFLGATLLSSISLSSGRVYMSTLLLVLGLILLIRFGGGFTIIPPIAGRPRAKMLVPLGGFAGFIDASGGGGWGPVTTPTLLTLTKTQPRRVIGTVSASEFVVAVSASAGFIFGMSNQNIDFKVVGGLLLGGVLMAPIAAKLAGKLPHAPFGALIGGAVLVINARIMLIYFEVIDVIRLSTYFSIILITLILAFLAWRRDKSTT
jgi:uncharacterized membrane protein YfcA